MIAVRAIAIALTAALLAWTGEAAAQARNEVVSPGPETLALAIYQDPGGMAASELVDEDGERYDARDDGEYPGLVLVTEWRTIDLPAGESRIRFRGVAEGIVAQTAAVDGLPAALVERNQDFDLLSAGAIVAGSVDQPVTWVQTDLKTGQETRERAIIRSGPNGVVLQIGDRYEALNCGGGAQRLVFDKLPDGLTDSPTLSVLVRTREAGRHKVRLSYLATGLLWSADYVAQVNPADGTLDLSGWITLANTTSVGFANAATGVVAGELEVDTGETVAVVTEPTELSSRCWPADTTTRGRRPPPPPAPPAAPMGGYDEGVVGEIIVTAQRRQESLQDVPIALAAEQSELGDYKLYTLAVPTTVAAHQTKQVMMFSRPRVKARRLYVVSFGPDSGLRVDEGPVAAAVLLTTRNTKANGLGLPLPGGKVVVTEPYGDQRLMSGQGAMLSTPVDRPLEIAVGESVDVQAQAASLDDDDDDRRRFEIVLTNAKPEAVDFELRLENAQGFKILRSSRKVSQGPTGPVWKLKLPANGRVVLSLTLNGSLQ